MLSTNTKCGEDINNRRLVPVIEDFMSSATTTPVLCGSNAQSFRRCPFQVSFGQCGLQDVASFAETFEMNAVTTTINLS